MGQIKKDSRGFSVSYCVVKPPFYKVPVSKLKIRGVCDSFVYTENCTGKSPFIEKVVEITYHLK